MALMASSLWISEDVVSIAASSLAVVLFDAWVLAISCVATLIAAVFTAVVPLRNVSPKAVAASIEALALAFKAKFWQHRA